MTIPVAIDEQLMEIPKHLPEDWRQLPAPPSTREFGTQWVMQARTPVMRVPGIVVDGEFNYILNPRHANFGQLKIGAPAPSHSTRGSDQVALCRRACLPIKHLRTQRVSGG
jgi:RES domain-containing protein